MRANIYYRWFLGYRLREDTPHFTTLSYNFRHRFTSETVDQVFNWILMEMVEAGHVVPDVVFVDDTHIKARKETIERVFADTKEKHEMRHTRYTGLAQVTNWVKLTFAAMNLKKFAK